MDATEKKNSADDDFQTYLMYRPVGLDSIFVTLRVLEWHWSGSATKDGAWSLDPGADSSDDPGSVDSTHLPEWDDHFTGLDYE